jgi:hypothetical protein
MKDFLSKKDKYFCDYADMIMSEFKNIRYGITSTCPNKSVDLTAMRYELALWQSDLDYSALSERVVINYLTWLPVTVQYEDNEGGVGYCYTEQLVPRSIAIQYPINSTTNQNIIEVNAGGCITQISVNPEINIDNSIHNTTGIIGAYTHNQSVASALWNITHSLGYPPNVITTDLSGNEISGVVTHIDNNTLTISFSQAVTGFAYLS